MNVVLEKKGHLEKVKLKQSFNGFNDENQFAPSYHVRSQ